MKRYAFLIPALAIASVSGTLALTGCVTYSAADLARDNARSDAEFKEREEYGASGSEFTLLEIEKNPDRWKDQILSFDGEVLWIKEGIDGTVFQVKVGKDSTLLVSWPKQEMPGIIKGMTVGLLGTVTGTVTGTNAFGGPVEAVGFSAKAYVLKIGPGYYKQIGGSATGDYIDGEKEAFASWKDKVPPLPR
jgi:hypothetical protein